MIMFTELNNLLMNFSAREQSFAPCRLDGVPQGEMLSVDVTLTLLAFVCSLMMLSCVN